MIDLGYTLDLLEENLVPADLVKQVLGKISDLHETMSVDTNIPADASLQKFVDEHGCVCVVCLAEEFGYEVLDPEE